MTRAARTMARGALLVVLWAAPAPVVARQQPAGVKDLPLIEAVAATPTSTFAVFVSGDGGWAAMDRDIAGALQRHGVSVIGINAMKYFWRTRTPDGAATDLARVIRHYLDAWKAERLLVVGYSRGAGVVPFMVNRLPEDLRRRVRMVVLLGAEHSAGFTFHVTDLFGSGSRKSEPPVMPEIERLGATPLACFYGADEDDTLCPELLPPRIVIKLPGGHHFDRNYAGIGERIHQEFQGLATVKP